MNCRVQPSTQAAQADTPRQQLINLDLACPRSDCRSTHPYAADRALLATSGGGFEIPRDSRRGPAALANEEAVAGSRRRGVEPEWESEPLDVEEAISRYLT